MGKVRQPVLAPGALAELIGELHALHARAGRPSMRDLARGQHFSYTAVHDLFINTTIDAPRLPVLSTVVEQLARLAPRANVDETLDLFDALWRKADAEPFAQPIEDLHDAATITVKISAGKDPVADVVTPVTGPAELTVDEETVALDHAPPEQEEPSSEQDSHSKDTASAVDKLGGSNDGPPEPAAPARRHGQLEPADGHHLRVGEAASSPPIMEHEFAGHTARVRAVAVTEPDGSPVLRESSALALLNQGLELRALGRSEEALEVFGRVAADYADDPAPVLRKLVASALFNQILQLEALGRGQEAATLYQRTVTDYADDPTLESPRAAQPAREMLVPGDAESRNSVKAGVGRWWSR